MKPIFWLYLHRSMIPLLLPFDACLDFCCTPPWIEDFFFGPWKHSAAIENAATLRHWNNKDLLFLALPLSRLRIIPRLSPKCYETHWVTGSCAELLSQPLPPPAMWYALACAYVTRNKLSILMIPETLVGLLWSWDSTETCLRQAVDILSLSHGEETDPTSLRVLSHSLLSQPHDISTTPFDFQVRTLDLLKGLWKQDLCLINLHLMRLPHNATAYRDQHGTPAAGLQPIGIPAPQASTGWSSCERLFWNHRLP